MTFVEVLLTALFCFAMVFALLAGLYISVKLLTNAVKLIEGKTKK